MYWILSGFQTWSVEFGKIMGNITRELDAEKMVQIFLNTLNGNFPLGQFGKIMGGHSMVICLPAVFTGKLKSPISIQYNGGAKMFVPCGKLMVQLVSFLFYITHHRHSTYTYTIHL